VIQRPSMKAALTTMAVMVAVSCPSCGEDEPAPSPTVTAVPETASPSAAEASPIISDEAQVAIETDVVAAVEAADRPEVPESVPAPVDPDALDAEVRDRLVELAAAVDAARTDGVAWLALADGLLAHGESAAAAIAYAGAVALLPADDPQFERAAYLRAVALNDAGETAASVDALAPFVQGSRTPQVHWRFALLLSSEGRLDEAMAAARAAIALDSLDMRAHAALAQVATEAGEWAVAEQAARAGLVINARNGHLYGLLAASLRAQEREAEAEELLGAGRFTRADWLDPWLRNLRDLRLGEAAAKDRFYEAMRSGDFARANREIESIASGADPASQGRVSLMQAQLAVTSNDPISAATFIEDAASGGVDECDVAIVRAMIATRQATSLESLDAVVDTLDSTVCDGDSDASRLELIGNIRLAQRRWSDAASALIAADTARQQGIGASLRKAITAMQKAGAATEALRLAEHLRSAEPMNADPHVIIAIISLQGGDLETALEAAATVERLAPEHPALARLKNQIRQATRR
jgi:tetratricopeptide (TPR) repeat protein